MPDPGPEMTECTADVAATYAAAAETRRLATPGDPGPRNPSKLVALVEGFSLEAGRHVHAHDRGGLARLCRYGARPPISMERLKRTNDGALVLGFKRAMADGSSGVRLTPFELLRRLAALVPPPGFHLVGYHGVFASRSKHRSRVVPTRTAEEIANDPVDSGAGLPSAGPDPELLPSISLAPDPRDRYLPWAELMKRTRDLDVLRCEKCGGRMQLMSFVTDPDEAREILAFLESQAATGPPAPATP